MIVNGSCLCGSVKYEVRLPFARFVNCYCSRCRKATGSAHATNAFVPPDSFRWTQGEALVVRYDLPEAQSFSTSFCSRCGSPLPRLTRSGREVIIPAGSFGEDPGVRPSVNRHWTSRAGWSLITSELPVEE